jgi:S1-C subfamily serine protease
VPVAWLGHSRWLEYGRWVSGVEILAVIPGSPGEAAGLQGSRPGVLHTTILMTGLLATAFFPPAMMGVIALNKAAEPHEMIIAVDGKRTCDVTDFEEAIQKAEVGEVVYIETLQLSLRRSQRADFERSSKKCRTRWTAWGSGMDSNRRPVQAKWPLPIRSVFLR